MESIRGLTIKAQRPLEYAYRPLCTILECHFHYLLPLQWMMAIVLAVFWSPAVYRGMEETLHPNVWLALFLGGLITFTSFCSVMLFSGRSTRHWLMASQLLMLGLLLHILS